MDKIQCSAPNSLNIITRCHGYLPSDHAGFASSWSIFRGNGYIDVISCLNFMLVHRFHTKKLFWRWMECTTFSGVPFTAFFMYVLTMHPIICMAGWYGAWNTPMFALYFNCIFRFMQENNKCKLNDLMHSCF